MRIILERVLLPTLSTGLSVFVIGYYVVGAEAYLILKGVLMSTSFVFAGSVLTLLLSGRIKRSN
jgi:uncharacterized membrane-anchored protein